jgi:putative peptidoglycan lipid II flippase
VKSVIQWISKWTGGSTNRKIFGAALIVGSLSFVAKLSNVAREVAVANSFGTGDMVDAFLIAYVFPMFLVNVFAGSFAAAVIPTFIHVRENEGEESSRELFASVSSWSIVFLFIVLIVAAMGGRSIIPLLGSGFGPEKLDLTRSLYYILMPMVLLNGLALFYTAILNAGERFALAAFTPALSPLVAVVALFAFGPRYGIFSLAAGTVIGFAAEAAILFAALRSRGFPVFNLRFGSGGHMKKIGGQYAPMVAGAFLMSGTILVDQAMAAMLGPGSVSALSYGNKVTAFVLGVGSLALGTAVFPHSSKLSAHGEWDKFTQMLKRIPLLIFVLCIPLTLFLVALSDFMIMVLFERGAFTVDDTALVSRVQTLYFLQIPFYLSGIIIVRMISSIKANDILLQTAVLSLVLNVVLNYIFMQWIGLPGIALSTTVVYISAAAYCLFSLAVRLRKETGQTLSQ